MYKVLKRDGSLQDFDWKKLVNGLLKSGATEEEAERVATQVEAWVSTVAVDGVIKSYDLHVRVLESIREINPAAAKNFEDFKKPEPQ
jgi:transcriptional regulator NrdR family protein